MFLTKTQVAEPFFRRGPVSMGMNRNLITLWEKSLLSKDSDRSETQTLLEVLRISRLRTSHENATPDITAICVGFPDLVGSGKTTG